MKCFLVLVVGFTLSIDASAQSDQLLTEHAFFKKNLLNIYKHLKASPEDQQTIDKLESLPFFPFDSMFRVRAILETATRSDFTGMKTTKGNLAMYRRYGKLTFIVCGKSFTMPVYQEKSAVASGSDELFFPFTDATNGESTYGGGRYIDLRIPKGNEMMLDFNRAFNPYCAYSHRYSCEIPPTENNFDIPIPAGVKYDQP